MARDPRYDILFEPVKIGPVTARNRFYQVPHCDGLGHAHPRGEAAMRGIKAEGGWAVVSTQECEIHPTSDISPYPEARLWDDRDIPALSQMCEAVHRHGSLAAIELTHHGPSTANSYSREIPIAPSPQPINSYAPVQARGMDKADIKAYRDWHRRAALRAKQAGFDIVYVYAGHNIALPMHFLQRRRNQRIDEYGGGIENRTRLLRELIEDTKDAVGATCGVAVRLAVDELLGPDGITSESEGREVIELLAELPDLWDVNVADWSNDSLTSRFAAEGFQEAYTSFVKKLTSKPVVGVGRFTSPDTMLSQIKRGVLDMIGAARPSIADPFLPRKIDEGRLDDIRECIGCNICVTGDFTCTPIRCTQNPTMGEEWRKGWHPEIIPAKGSTDAVLVVGGGPAGLECARALGQRGYTVVLTEATDALGGRVSRESQLPGLAAWARVRDHRLLQLEKMPNVTIYRKSEIEAEHILELGVGRVVLATGARWRKDGVGRVHSFTVPGFDGADVHTPDDIMAGANPTGPVVVYDDDHFYMASVIVERLRQQGHAVTLVTPADMPAAWTVNTLESGHIHKKLLEMDVAILTGKKLEAFSGRNAKLACVHTGRRTEFPCRSVVTVTSRIANQSLYQALMFDRERLAASGVKSITAIGDCWAPGTIAAAVYAGHRYAREMDAPAPADVAFERQLPA